MRRIIPCVIITLLMMLAGIFMPLMGVIGLMLCPLPLAVLGCVEGHKQMSIAELMIEVTLFIVVAPSMAVYFLIGCAPVSGMLFLLSRDDIKSVKKFTGAESLLLCTATSIVFKIILIVSFWLFTNKNIMFPDIQQMKIILSDLYANQPELQASVNTILNVFPYLFPTMLMLYSIAEGFLNYSLCYKFTKKLFPGIKNFPPELPEFKQWKFPTSILFASIFAFISGYFIDTETWFGGAIFVMNLQLVISALMFIQGVSVAFWIMDGFKLRRGSKIFVCIILSFPFFWPWLIVIGMSELALNLRNRIKFKK